MHSPFASFSLLQIFRNTGARCVQKISLHLKPSVTYYPKLIYSSRIHNEQKQK